MLFRSDPALLDAKDPDEGRPAAVRPVATQASGSSPEEQLAAMDDAYALRYRPASNPVRLNVAGRVMFANVSGQDRVNGRLGGASIDVGPSWNRVGVSGTLTGWGGRVLLPPATGGELNAMIGGGLTLSLGRLALLSHGFLDLRLGLQHEDDRRVPGRRMLERELIAKGRLPGAWTTGNQIGVTRK